MSRLSNASTNLGLEMRMEKLERSHSSLEARLINLTTLIRSHYQQKESPSNEQNIYDIASRLKRLEDEKAKPLQKINEIEDRVKRIEEKLPLSDFQKTLDQTHEKIKLCINELKESIKVKEQELSDNITGEINTFKKNLDLKNH